MGAGDGSLVATQMNTGSVLQWFCVVCFLGAALRHGLDLSTGGWLPYRYVPIWTNLFWTALTFLDPFTALALWYRPRLGVVLALLVMLTEVSVNTFWTLRFGQAGVLSGPGVLTLVVQTIFLGMILRGFPLLRSLSPSPAVRKP